MVSNSLWLCRLILLHRVFCGRLLRAMTIVTICVAFSACVTPYQEAGFSGRARAVGAAFAAWLALVYLCDLGAIGLAIARALSPGQVFALSLVNPVEQARVLGTLALTNRPEVLGPAGLYGADHFGPLGLQLLLLGALFTWSLASLAAGFSLFRKAVV